MRRLVCACCVTPVLALAALAPSAQAEGSCTPNSQGLAASGGAAPSDVVVCAPAWGRPAGTGTGRKVG